MPSRLVFALLVLSLTIVAGCSSNRIQSPPPDWNDLPILSGDCSEVFGNYGEAYSRESGNPVPSIWAFGFYNTLDKVRAGDETVKSRRVLIALGTENEIVISYFVDEKLITSRIAYKADYSCSPNGLDLIIRNEYGTVYDKLPNYGNIEEVATLWRDQQYLYVRRILKYRALTLYSIPSWGKNEAWYRFPVYQ